MTSDTVAVFDVAALGRAFVSGCATHGRLLLAHGAGAGPEHPVMVRLREALVRHGVQVIAIEFAYRALAREAGRPRPPPGMSGLTAELRQWRALLPPGTWLGGRSMGARVASLLAAGQGASGLALFGYPFHPPRKPERLRLGHWSALCCPTHVFQGTRDPFGCEAEVVHYPLPADVRVHWLRDGDHDLQPRRRSGLTQWDLMDHAARQAAEAMCEGSCVRDTVSGAG